MDKLPTLAKNPIYWLQRSSAVLAAVLFLFSICSAQGNERDVINRSNFIFSGTIVKMNASNIEVVPNVPTAVVRVDEVLDAVSPYERMKGKEITVLLASSKNKKAGDRQVFFTSGWFYGKTLGVKETPNNLTVGDRLDDLKKRIVSERVNIVNDSLRDELKRAVLVIRGIVIEANIEIEKRPGLESEHNPEFKKAVIEIKEVLKGQTTERRVDVIYSSSDDVQWYNSPKLTRGQDAIFLLQVRQAPPIFRINGFTVLDKRDVVSPDSESSVKNLLKN